MISSTLKIISCLFAVCLMVQAQSPAQKTNTGTISGKVTFKGNGLPGIAVVARPTQATRGRNTLMATTDQEGNYRISNVAAGQYYVRPAAPQFLVANQTPDKTLMLGEGENVESVDFALVRGGVITGKVMDADGKAMIEEPIEVFAVESLEGKERVTMNIFAGPTDDRGVYRIFGLRPGKYRVAAGVSQDRMYFGRGTRSVYSQTFHPSIVEPSEATLVEVREGSEAANVDITLRRTLNIFAVHARVVDAETGKPIANAKYGLHKFQLNGSTTTTGRSSDRFGEIRIDSVTPGKYALYIEPSLALDVFADPVRFEVVDHDVKDLVIKASSGGSVSGVIVFDGGDEKVAIKPRELTIRAMIRTRDSYIGGASSGGIINADGSFRMGGLRPGVVEFSMWERLTPASAFEIVQIERDGVVQSGVEIKAGEHLKGLRLVAKIRTGRISGMVKIENGRIAFSQVQVQIKRSGENSGQALQVDDRGRFISEPLAAGIYEVVVSAYPLRGRPTAAKQQVAVTDNEVTDVTLTLDLKSDTGQGKP